MFRLKIYIVIQTNFLKCNFNITQFITNLKTLLFSLSSLHLLIILSASFISHFTITKLLFFDFFFKNYDWINITIMYKYLSTHIMYSSLLNSLFLAKKNHRHIFPKTNKNQQKNKIFYIKILWKCLKINKKIFFAVLIDFKQKIV